MTKTQKVNKKAWVVNGDQHMSELPIIRFEYDTDLYDVIDFECCEFPREIAWNIAEYIVKLLNQSPVKEIRNLFKDEK